MFFQNQKQDKIATMFVSATDSPSVDIPEFNEVESSGFDVDASSFSSMVFLGSQDHKILPMKLEVEEEPSLRCKRLKLTAPAQQSIYFNIPENSSPLGLTLRKTPSFLDLVESKLSHSSLSLNESTNRMIADAEVHAQQGNGKIKASNLSASLLRIGSWEHISRYDGELVAKCYYAKRKLVWEVLDGGLKNKIEVMWSDIASMKATCNDNAPQTLEIELLRPPIFFKETNPQPRKHTLWKATVDFTGGQASIFRRHFLQFPQGTLQQHYKKLLQLDKRLSSLSKQPYPSFDSPFFGRENVGNQYPNDQKLFGLEGQDSNLLKQLFESGTSDDYSNQFHCFALSRTTVPQNYTNLDRFVSSLETSSSTLEASSGDHETSILIGNALPSLFVSLPPYVSDFGTATITGSYSHMERRTDEVPTEMLNYSLDLVGLPHEKLNSRFNIDSTFDLKSNFWVSEIQTNHNLVHSLGENFDCEMEIGTYINGGISYSGQVNNNNNLQKENFGNWGDLLMNVSESTSAPVFVVNEQAGIDEIEEVVEWTSWT